MIPQDNFIALCITCILLIYCVASTSDAQIQSASFIVSMPGDTILGYLFFFVKRYFNIEYRSLIELYSEKY